MPRLVLLLLATVIVAIGASKGSADEPVPEQLLGEWHGESSMPGVVTRCELVFTKEKKLEIKVVGNIVRMDYEVHPGGFLALTHKIPDGKGGFKTVTLITKYQLRDGMLTFDVPRDLYPMLH